MLWCLFKDYPSYSSRNLCFYAISSSFVTFIMLSFLLPPYCQSSYWLPHSSYSLFMVKFYSGPHAKRFRGAWPKIYQKCSVREHVKGCQSSYWLPQSSYSLFMMEFYSVPHAKHFRGAWPKIYQKCSVSEHVKGCIQKSLMCFQVPRLKPETKTNEDISFWQSLPRKIQSIMIGLNHHHPLLKRPPLSSNVIFAQKIHPMWHFELSLE